MISARLQLEPIEDAVQHVVSELAARKATELLWERDDRLFGSPATECANRMGWLDAPAWADAVWDEVRSDARERLGSVDDVVLLGMGGSSLFPEVLASTFGGPRLHLVDTTHPHHLRRVLDGIDPRAAHVVSSKSGTTIETASQMAAWLAGGRSPDRFVVVTDPGSQLDRRAADLGVAWTVHGDPDVGGRYSALTAFGVVPAALLGVDAAGLAESALDQFDALHPEVSADDHEAVWLAAAMAAAEAHGREQLTVMIEPRFERFGDWLEQLVAESLGKNGRGLIPVIGEHADHVVTTPARRLIVTIGDVDGLDALRACGAPLIELSMEEPLDLGAQVVFWQVAVALAGAAMGCNPFDQPDVESAKVQAREVLATPAGSMSAEVPMSSIDELLFTVAEGDCVNVCAFIDPGGPYREPIATARRALGRHLGVATTLGIGPRFLHSSGQLHKGGPGNQLMVQVVESIHDDLTIPEAPFTFGRLITAQAAGDFGAIAASGHRVVRVELDAFVELAHR